MKVKLTKFELIKAHKANCLNDYGKGLLIDKFLKFEEKKREETGKKISKTMRKNLRYKIR